MFGLTRFGSVSNQVITILIDFGFVDFLFNKLVLQRATLVENVWVIFRFGSISGSLFCMLVRVWIQVTQLRTLELSRFCQDSKLTRHIYILNFCRVEKQIPVIPLVKSCSS